MRSTPPPTTNANASRIDANANVARYDVRMANEMAQRERDALDAQRKRDERRRAYDALCDAQPITQRLRETRYVNARSDLANRAFVPRAPRVARLDGTCVGCLRPLRECDRDPRKHAPTRNAWERMDVHMGTHKRPDPTCHHPLVKCVHKW